MPGLPAASHFSCFAKKSNQKKATRGSSPGKSAGCLALLESTGRCGTRARIGIAQEISCVLALRQSSRTAPVVSALLSDSHRDPASPLSLSSRRRPGSKLTLFCLGSGLRREDIFFESRSSCTVGAPCESPSSGANAGDLREDCLSGEHKLNLLCHCRFEPRVPQRPAFVSSGGNPKGDEPGVAFSLGTFFWRSKRKCLAAGQPPACALESAMPASTRTSACVTGERCTYPMHNP